MEVGDATLGRTIWNERHTWFVAPAAVSAHTDGSRSRHKVAPNGQCIVKGAPLGLASWQPTLILKDGSSLLEQDDPVLARHAARAGGEEEHDVGLAPTDPLYHCWGRSPRGLNLKAAGGDL
jgi:hypothetical protein